MMGVVALTFAMATPALTQGRGGGGSKNKPSKCVDDAFLATLEFMQHPDGDGPAIYPAGFGDGDPFVSGTTLSGTLGHGNIASRVGNQFSPDFPVHIDLSLGPNGYADFHEGDEDQINVDPYVSTWVRTNDANLDTIECQMFGMVVGVTDTYVMRLSVQWWEDLNGDPVTREEEGNKRWMLRFKPVSSGDPTVELTWLNAVRKSNDEWELTSRNDSDAPHFASLERDGSKGKVKEPKAVSKPVMPLKLVIRVICPDGCPVPETTGS
jgi:hypothetical protein